MLDKLAFPPSQHAFKFSTEFPKQPAPQPPHRPDFQSEKNAPNPPPINYTPYGHPDYPKAICPCNSNVISTTKCEGATYNWTVTPSSVTFSGQGTSQITLNGSTLADPLNSISIKVVITCPSGVSVTSTQNIPVLNGCNTAGTPSFTVSMTSGSAGTLAATASCPNFGQGWTLKAWDLPHNANCSQWEPGPIIAQGTGASFNFNNVQTGKYYRLAYYSERCSKTWKNQCTKVKFVCFTVYPTTGKMPSGFTGGQTKVLSNGTTLVYFLTDGDDPNNGKQ